MRRFLHIDFLRALAIIAVIVIHVFSYNLNNKFNFFVWNYLHFIIVAFIFCSGYVMYAKYREGVNSLSSILIWYKKRLVRLILPFFYYLSAHYALMFFFPKFFSGLGLQFSWSFFLQSITFIGGISLNWLPLLFLELTVLFPILVLIFNKKRILFKVYLFFAFAITLGFTIWQFPYDYYRWVMWIPWSLFLVLPWYFFKKEQNKALPISYFIISGVSLIVFVFLYFLWRYFGRSVTLIDSKYPPNIFYISYEMFGSFLILGISFWKIWQNKYTQKIYGFLSKASYSLFFIHYIILDFVLSLNKMLGGQINVWWQLGFVLIVSYLIAWLFNVFSHQSFIFQGHRN